MVSDYNFVREGNECVPVGPEPIPAGVCDNPNQMYKGSSGYRKIPGNTCEGGHKDDLVEKKCSEGRRQLSLQTLFSLTPICSAQPKEGDVTHKTVSYVVSPPKMTCLTCLSVRISGQNCPTRLLQMDISMAPSFSPLTSRC